MNIINNSKLIYKKISLSSGIFSKEEKKEQRKNERSIPKKLCFIRAESEKRNTIHKKSHQANARRQNNISIMLIHQISC
jgi:hypothetical protein